MINSKVIKNWYGERIGELKEDSRGNTIAYDRYGAILGTYNPKLNITTEFPSGRIVSSGDTTSALIWEAERKREERLKNTKK